MMCYPLYHEFLQQVDSSSSAIYCVRCFKQIWKVGKVGKVGRVSVANSLYQILQQSNTNSEKIVEIWKTFDLDTDF